MNIFYIVPYTPNLIRVRPYNLIRSLARRGHQVTVATLWSTAEERADLDRLAADSVHLIAERLPTWHSLWNCLCALPTRTPLQAVYCWQPALAEGIADRLSQIADRGSRIADRGSQIADRRSRIADRVSRVADRSSPPATSSPKSEIRNAVLSSSKGPKFDIVHVEHLRGTRYGLRAKSEIRNSKFEIPIVWDSVDCISYLFEQAAQNSRSLKGRLMTRLELERTRRYEAWLVGQFDRVLVTSDVDRDALLELARTFEEEPEEPRGTRRQGDKEMRRQGNGLPLSPSPPLCVTVLPNGVDLDYFTPTDEPREPATLVITGKMSYHANVTAVLHLIHDIMPHVWARRPDVTVWIVGKDPPSAIRTLATRYSSSVIVTGAVPDMRPYLRRATIAAVSLVYGAGSQFKVMEAMACGTPVVASPQATSALATQPGRDLVVAEGAEAFAQAVLALLDDPARRAQLGQAGRAYVEQHHSWDAIAGRLETIYQDTIRARHLCKSN